MPNRAAPPSYGAPPAYAPSGESAPVRRDLAGNVIPNAASATPPPANPYAYAPGPQVTPQPGTWPPPPSGNAAGLYSMPQARNTSGSQGDVPPEIARLKWNWGAFCIPRLWCYRHGLRAVATALWVTAYLLRFLHGVAPPIQVQIISVLYYVADYALAIYLGFKGNEMAWRNRHFPGGIEEFFKVQRAWMIGGLIWQAIWISLIVWMFSQGFAMIHAS
jgi:hypothetical protein